MKIRALKSFEGIKDNERNVFPKAGDVWEVSEERANFLKEHGVIEFVEEKKEKVIEVEPEVNISKETIEEGNKIISDGLKEMIFGKNILKEKPKKKKSSKK